MMYKGYELHYCWCGYPERRWMIYRNGNWLHTAKTLREAKIWINGK